MKILKVTVRNPPMGKNANWKIIIWYGNLEGWQREAERIKHYNKGEENVKYNGAILFVDEIKIVWEQCTQKLVTRLSDTIKMNLSEDIEEGEILPDKTDTGSDSEWKKMLWVWKWIYTKQQEWYWKGCYNGFTFETS